MAISFKKKAPIKGTVKEEVTSTGKDADGEVTKKTEVKQDKEVNLGTVEVPTQHALVEFSASMTKNLGNYESAKVHVGLTMPCDPEKIEEAFEYASGWVNGKLEQVLGE